MNYVGIDLGTTNSAIASFDGSDVRLYKSPEQHDVTPSAIFVDRRGGRYVGRRAYEAAVRNPDNAAVLFKRLMGTSTPISLPGPGITMTPEAASAEILQTLVGYLPDDIRSSGDVGTVITVPAAFNELQKAATMDAAQQANIGRVALMQEPVAAVMSVMASGKADGIFIIYDLGGGTLDIAIAESLNGRVNLLAHGGVAMLGGRDFDRTLFDQVTKPWLFSTFHLPPNLHSDPTYRSLVRVATWATEQAKIQLSQRESATIALSEDEIRLRDLDGQEIYVEIPLDRARYDEVIRPRLLSSLDGARATIADAGLTPDQIEQVIFVGGPTHYGPLRETVSFELGISKGVEINPMTAVATGAAVFAESIDWSSESHGRRATRGSMKLQSFISFNYQARTPAATAKVVAKVDDREAGVLTVQFTCLETGWVSGRLKLGDGQMYELPLPENGIFTFAVDVMSSTDAPVKLDADHLTITRTHATIEQIPASNSIAVEVLSKAGGARMPAFLVRKGEPLPHKGRKLFRAAQDVLAGSDDALNFRLLAGEDEHDVQGAPFIGLFQIKGTDLVEGRITAGDEVLCDYEIRDSGEIVLSVTIPSVGGAFSSEGMNLYSRQEAQHDFTQASQHINQEKQDTLSELERMEGQVSDHRLDKVREKLEQATELNRAEADPEQSKHAMESVREAKRILADIRRDYRYEIRMAELESLIADFDKRARPYARPDEEAAFDNQVRTARRFIDTSSHDAEERIDALRLAISRVLWRQNSYVQDWFEEWAECPWLFSDQDAFGGSVEEGRAALMRGDFSRLRGVLYKMSRNRSQRYSEDGSRIVSNLIHGG